MTSPGTCGREKQRAIHRSLHLQSWCVYSTLFIDAISRIVWISLSNRRTSDIASIALVNGTSNSSQTYLNRRRTCDSRQTPVFALHGYSDRYSGFEVNGRKNQAHS